MISKDEVTIVIPTMNEQEAIMQVLRELKEHGYGQILVVDGYSTDKTVDNAKENGAKVIYQHGRGKGKAIKTATEHVTTRYMLVMDGDYTYDPKCIDSFLLHAENYDHIIGARINGRRNISRMHRFGNWTINKVFNLLMGANLTDVCSGMYLLSAKTAKGLNLSSTGFDVEVEIAAQTTLDGRATEVPVSYRNRLGKAKLSWRHGLWILTAIMRLARTYNPVFLFSAITSIALVPASVIFLWAILEHMMSGIWHSEFALVGVMLFVLGLQSLTTGAVSILLKRLERRLIQRL